MALMIYAPNELSVARCSIRALTMWSVTASWVGRSPKPIALRFLVTLDMLRIGIGQKDGDLGEAGTDIFASGFKYLHSLSFGAGSTGRELPVELATQSPPRNTQRRGEL